MAKEYCPSSSAEARQGIKYLPKQLNQNEMAQPADS
jgi:hypothetical protein